MIVQIIITVSLFIIAGSLWYVVYQMKKDAKRRAEN
jgi:hypothetical protein